MSVLRRVCVPSATSRQVPNPSTTSPVPPISSGIPRGGCWDVNIRKSNKTTLPGLCGGWSRGTSGVCVTRRRDTDRVGVTTHTWFYFCLRTRVPRLRGLFQTFCLPPLFDCRFPHLFPFVGTGPQTLQCLPCKTDPKSPTYPQVVPLLSTTLSLNPHSFTY